VDLANECGGHDNITVVLLQYPVTGEAVKNTGPAVALSEEVATFPSPASRKTGRQWGKATLFSAILLLVLVAGAGWYFATPKEVLVPPGHTFVAAADDSTQPGLHQLKHIGRDSHPAVAGPATIEKADTLAISSTQDFADLKRYADSTGRQIVLVPKKSGITNFTAVAITVRSAKPGDTLIIRNLRLVGFSNGIDIHLPVLLKAENLVFENIANPFRYVGKAGNKRASILLINTAKL
jgi:hypothetical protein